MSQSIDPWQRKRGKPRYDADGRKILKPLPEGVSYTWRRDKNRQWLRDADGDRIPGSRYRTRANTRAKPPGKSRHQVTGTHSTLAEAKQWLAQVKAGVIDWEPPTESALEPETVNDRLDVWLANRGRTVRPVTVKGYEVSAKHWRTAFGDTLTTELTRSQISDHVDNMTDAGSSPATVRAAMVVLRGALREAVSEGVLDRDPSALVALPARKPPTKRAWTAEQAREFLTAIDADRNAPLFQLSLVGLRRSELLGLRWSDIEDDTIRVQRGRVAVDSHTVHEGAPKSARSLRTLPIAGMSSLVAALKRLRTERAREALSLGVPLKESDYLAVDTALEPYRPERYSDIWREAVESVPDLPVLTLHEARHTAATLLAASGVAPEVAADWLGHDPAMYLRTYVHVDRDRAASAGVKLGQALG